MKNIFYAVVFVSIVFVICPGKSFSSDGIKWYSYKEGMALGKNQGKKIYLYFTSVRCGYCRKIENSTFKDPLVISYVNENFIPINVSFDKERDLITEYRVNGVPANWFISEKGERIGNRPGYMPANEFLVFLKYVKTDSYKTKTLSDFVKNQAK